MDEFVMNIGNGSVRRLVSKLVTKAARNKTKLSSLDIVLNHVDAASKGDMVMLTVNANVYVNAEELTGRLKEGKLL